jgi:DNA-binding NarL/FixJ family response regulator
MCIVLTRYQPECQDWPHGRRTIFTPDQYMLDDDSTQYGEIPCVDLHYEPAATSFWTGDFVTDLAPGNKFLNKRMSQLGESANSSVYELLLLGPELAAADIPTDIPGVVEDGLDENGNPRVEVLQRGQLPQFFLESIKMIVEFIESTGSADLLSHRQFPGQLRGPLAIPMLQEILDSEDGPLLSHLGEQLAKVKQMRVNRVKQFYPPIRTLHYTSGGKNEVLVFHTEAILRSGTSYHITVDLASLQPELSVLRHARVREDMESPLAIIYTNRRTGRIDPSKIAMALKYNDRAELDRDVQYRKLAQHLIAMMWKGKPVDQNAPYPFWDHNAMMDEYEATMATTEWLEASDQIKTGFLTMYEKHRQYLDAIQAAAAQSIQSQQMKGAIAQATQQVAAKVAAETVEQSMAQIRESVAMAQPMGRPLEADLAGSQQGTQGRTATGPLSTRQQSPGATEMNIQQLLGRR